MIVSSKITNFYRMSDKITEKTYNYLVRPFCAFSVFKKSQKI